ncbi:double-strand break repair helicase AddA [Agrobacterium rubi TR3 = NBRC 13261]|uniref:DNA 3'-5' helicase n=1 Tax=Agrobacterium rubi TR3 = NBRC 13261 TaxID=1368415 RepID=A0A081CXX0_9HYPH|nr:double-strand break repair helicase AddA [Agrobacterium rubi]MBP1879550.1 ATP-dependent helicase/nuclease subunit A [Agrobacterium rubi]MCL6654262.1 double-strand break repair helicase AddA [Agrobacterium rubi]GAK71516.1 double-strand break repair helicase AddA [Agrobacterium rubi TR3 = NBRC 13261]
MLSEIIDHGPAQDDPKSWIDWTSAQQTRASDPTSSAWVSANAGSGKTHVLTQRVIRLLLAGCRPSAILCLTYTKAAASEMSSRVFDRLADWATLSNADLSDRITAIEGRVPDLIKLKEARRLFAKALETPGGLKIQTIHAFCEALLHQFPLEANVAGHFSVLDDRAASTLLAEARRTLLTAVSIEADQPLAQALAYVLDIADETGLEALLSAIVSNRNAISGFLEQARRAGGIDASLRARAGIGPQETEETAAAAYWPLPGLSGLSMETYLTLGDEIGGSRVIDVAYALREAARTTDVFKRVEFIEAALLTSQGAPKSDAYVINKAMQKSAPALLDDLTAARAHVVASRDRYRTLRMLEATKHALTLAERLIGDFEDLKKQRSQLDFEDLIERAATLLNRDTAGAWVHYKLDQGIDHILVDEAQDTSPVQWSIIQSLAADFFHGETAREGRRTVFAVGDEKQSIYSFQGARPERFSQESRETQRRVTAVEQTFHSVRLPLSFRSTDDVLAAVDQVFSLPEHAEGLSAEKEPVEHRSNRHGQAGTVELWDMIAAEPVENEEDWTAPFDALRESAPPAIVARRIAARIAEMIGKETVVEKGVERTIEAGDILVLVRKRHAFVNALTRELKQRKNIPVAGADRLRLTDHIAIQDLLALGRFVLLPQDDLSLSALLKSPLFNHSEDDIFEVAAKRPPDTSVWHYVQLISAQPEGRQFVASVSQLLHFITLSKTQTIHDFFAAVLTLHEGRAKFLGRLGNEASDVLDEFLSFALDHERTGLPGLQSFISVMETDAPEIKREQDKERGEVRIMTVHASKGLEAPVVFLVDGGSKAFIHSHLPKLRFIETHDTSLPIWLPGKGFDNALVSKDEERLKLSAEQEYRRLLYVAMTRAADHLIVCGYRGPRENLDCWHAMIARSLAADENRCKRQAFSAGGEEWDGLLWHSTSRDAKAIAKTEPPPLLVRDVLPPSLMQPLPPPPVLPRPLSPSGAGTIIDDGSEDLLVTSPLFAKQEVSSGLALQRGRLVHRMLQTLPEYPPDQREDAARRYAERAARFWPDKERESLIRSTLAVLSEPALQSAFSANSRAEISIMGTLRLGTKDYAVSGRIDRLAVEGDRVILVDYKTNRVPPVKDADIPLAHKAQLAIYKSILAPLYPGKNFTCALVYTENASFVTLSDEALIGALAAIETK